MIRDLNAVNLSLSIKSGFEEDLYSSGKDLAGFSIEELKKLINSSTNEVQKRTAKKILDRYMKSDAKKATRAVQTNFTKDTVGIEFYIKKTEDLRELLRKITEDKF